MSLVKELVSSILHPLFCCSSHRFVAALTSGNPVLVLPFVVALPPQLFIPSTYCIYGFNFSHVCDKNLLAHIHIIIHS